MDLGLGLVGNVLYIYTFYIYIYIPSSRWPRKTGSLELETRDHLLLSDDPQLLEGSSRFLDTRYGFAIDFVRARWFLFANSWNNAIKVADTIHKFPLCTHL